MKNNKKGFTLLEVLGVIVVLAAIALITIPMVTNVMKDAKKSSFTTSMTNLVKSADNYYADNQLSIDSVMTFCYGLTGGSTCTSEKLKHSGVEPKQGKLIINPDGEISLVDMSNGTYYANYNSSSDDAVVITETNDVLTRDELTQAVKDLQKKLSATEKKLEDKDSAQQIQIDSNTVIANTANNTANSLNNDIINKTYPVGSIYISYSNTNPSSLFGGTWIAYAPGKTLVGIDPKNVEFNSAGSEGGRSSVELSVANLPSHSHVIPALSGTTSDAGNHNHSYTTFKRNFHVAVGNGSPDVAANLDNMSESRTSGTSGSHVHSVTINASNTEKTGSGSSVNIQNPYITTYMWRRTS